VRVGIEQGVFEVCDVGIIQGKLALQGTIGYAPTPPQHVEGLVQDLLKGHACPSTPARYPDKETSPKAAQYASGIKELNSPGLVRDQGY